MNRISSRRLSDLRQTLDAIPSTLQDRWFGRLYLGMPFAVAVLSVFWILTGVIALLKFEESIQMSGLTQGPGAFFVASGSLVDIALGGVILYRPWSRAACCGMAAITFVYVVAGSLLRPDLWLDPLGPLLKALPVLVLTLMTALLLEDR